MKSYYQSVIGALLHDIGKLVQRAQWDEITRKHAEVGKEFLEGIETLKGSEFSSPIIEFVGMHHDKESQELSGNRTYNSIVEGDQISASERKERENKGKPNIDPLIPISAKINVKIDDSNTLGLEKEEENKWGFTNITEETFPFPNNENPKLSQEIYKKLNSDFIKDFDKIIEIYKSSLSGEEHLENFVVSLLSVLKRYTSYIPSAAYKSEADISLFDHSRVAAAVAGCLYHEPDGNKPFLYLAGDLSGIQNFIYNIVAHNEDAHTKFTKRLRGRSLYISLLTDGIAHYILRELGLSEPHLLLSGGGNFNILLPNSEGIKNKLDETITKIQRFLHKKFQGRIGIVTAFVEANKDDLMCDFNKFLHKLGEKLDEEKKKKLDKILENGFDTKNILHFPNNDAVDICPSCGDDVFQKGSICNMCELHQKIGEVLPRAKYLYFLMEKPNMDKSDNSIFVDFSELFTWVLSTDEVENIPKNSIRFLIDTMENENLKSSLLSEDKSTLFLPEKGSSKIGYSYKWIGKYLPGYDNDKNVLTFEDIANESQGAKYLGVVRMDVDNMGAIFALGFDREKEIDEKYSTGKNCKLASISRFAQLSRQLDTFFSGYLVEMLKNDHPNVYLGYSGGDDLFFVAPWNEAIELSMEISDKFKEYMYNNPAFHLSGGMIITKPKFPIAKSSFLAGDKEEMAKNRDGKDSFCLFNRVLKWEELDKAEQIKDELGKEIKSGKISRGAPYRLLQLLRMYTIIEKKENKTFKKYHPALFSRVRLYLHRIVANSEKDKNTQLPIATSIADKIETTIRTKGGKGIEIVEVALNWCALEMRENKKKEEEK